MFGPTGGLLFIQILLHLLFTHAAGIVLNYLSIVETAEELHAYYISWGKYESWGIIFEENFLPHYFPQRACAFCGSSNRNTNVEG